MLAGQIQKKRKGRKQDRWKRSRRKRNRRKWSRRKRQRRKRQKQKGNKQRIKEKEACTCKCSYKLFCAATTGRKRTGGRLDRGEAEARSLSKCIDSHLCTMLLLHAMCRFGPKLSMLYLSTQLHHVKCCECSALLWARVYSLLHACTCTTAVPGICPCHTHTDTDTRTGRKTSNIKTELICLPSDI